MITGADFASVASHLKDRMKGEASIRTQIGRLYYAAFTEAVRLCVEKYQFVPEGSSDDHHAVRRSLEEHGAGSIAKDLNTLRVMRNLADYKTNHECPRPKLSDAEDLAQSISKGISQRGGNAFVQP